jgi:hypothetical protein
VRKYLSPAVIAAARAARARRPPETGIPLYLPAFDDRFGTAPVAQADDDAEVDASGITVGGDEDDDFY